jgi:hypothetical protein
LLHKIENMLKLRADRNVIDPAAAPAESPAEIEGEIQMSESAVVDD